MALGATLDPRMEHPDPPINGHSGGASPKTPTDSPELGQEPLSSRPNEGPIHARRALLTPTYVAKIGALRRTCCAG